MTEMEADLERARIAAEAEIKVAQVNADAAIERARQERKWRNSFNRDGLLFSIVLVVVLVITVGGFIGQHMYHNYNYQKTVELCEKSGGTWTTKYQDMKPSNNQGGDIYTDRTEYCDRSLTSAR